MSKELMVTSRYVSGLYDHPLILDIIITTASSFVCVARVSYISNGAILYK